MANKDGVIPLGDGAGLFHVEPDELAHTLEDTVLRLLACGQGAVTERLLPYLEGEAIARLRHAGIDPGLMDERHLERHNREAWRLHWVNEARLHLRHVQNEPMGPKWSAAELLTRASDLRYAIEDGNAEKTAALGALLACWVFIGGVSVRLAFAEPTAEAFKESQRDKAEQDRTTLEADGKRVRKRDLVSAAFKAAGPGAGTAEVWPHLVGVLDLYGLKPLEYGAKNERRIDVIDGEGRPLAFTFKGVQNMLRDLRNGTPGKRGRPAKKPA